MLTICSRLVVVKKKVEWFPEVIRSEVPPKLLLVVISKVHSDNLGTSTRPHLRNLRIWFFFLRGAAAGRISIRQQLCEFSRCECRLPPGLDRASGVNGPPSTFINLSREVPIARRYRSRLGSKCPKNTAADAIPSH